MRKPRPQKIVLTADEAFRVVMARRSMERADFFMQFVEDVMPEGGRWGRLYLGALIDAVWEHLVKAIDTIEPLARRLEKK